MGSGRRRVQGGSAHRALSRLSAGATSGGFQPQADFQSKRSLSALADSRSMVGKLADNLQRQLNVVDTLSISQRGHLVKLGVDYRRLLPQSSPSQYGLTPLFGGFGLTTPCVPAPVRPAPSSVTSF